MENPMSQYTVFTRQYTSDTYKNVFVSPAHADECEAEKGWYGEVIGRVHSKGKWANSRDKRCRYYPQRCDSPALWGIVVKDERDWVDFCENLGAEGVCRKLGIPKRYAQHLGLIVQLHRSEVAMIQRWVAAGGPCSSEAVRCCQRCMQAPGRIEACAAIAAKSPKMTAEEIIDTERCLGILGVTLAEAHRAYRQHCDWVFMKNRKHFVFCGIHKVTLKKERLDVHDFLVDLLEAVEARGDTAELLVEQQLKFQAPEGWEHIPTPKKLISVSNSNGWCTKLRYYWERMKGGEMFFFCADKGLAHYSSSGKLLQAKSPRNERDLTAEMPFFLEQCHEN